MENVAKSNLKLTPLPKRNLKMSYPEGDKSVISMKPTVSAKSSLQSVSRGIRKIESSIIVKDVEG